MILHCALIVCLVQLYPHCFFLGIVPNLNFFPYFLFFALFGSYLEIILNLGCTSNVNLSSRRLYHVRQRLFGIVSSVSRYFFKQMRYLRIYIVIIFQSNYYARSRFLEIPNVYMTIDY